MASPRDERLEGRVRELAEPLAAGHGLDLVEVEVKGHAGSRVVRLVVDADEGVDVEDCALLSQDVGGVLDEQDVVPGRHTLQVTSPGADRPLRTPRDFARNVGRPVRLQARPGAELPGELSGVVVAAGDESVTLEVDGERRVVRLADVDHGRVLLPW
jgi:ribosome maturation factor RimP